MKKFYLDTCIWRDYFENRSDGLKPLGEFAFQFLKKCKEKNFQIIYSDIILFELKDYSEEYVQLMFYEFKKILIKKEATGKQRDQAKKEIYL